MGTNPSPAPGRVCSVFNDCVDINDSYEFDCEFVNIVNNTNESLTLEATLLERLDKIDMVIGLQTIIPNDLVNKMLRHRSRTALRADRHTTTRPGTESAASLEYDTPVRCCPTCVTPGPASVAKRQKREESASRERQRVADAAALIAQIEAFQALYSDNCTTSGTATAADAAFLPGLPDGEPVSTIPKQAHGLPGLPDDRSASHPCGKRTARDPEGDSETTALHRDRPVASALNDRVARSCELCSLIVDKSVLLTPEPQIEEIDEPESLDFDDIPTEGDVKSDIELPGPNQIFGSEPMQASISELCRKYSDIFSSNVKENPARVRPFEIEVDGTEWKIPASRRAPRPQSHEKTTALKGMVEDMMRRKVIRHSNAEHASQVLLVVKKNTKKLRLCIDYRELNEICKTDSWPIPNILDLLNRIGDKKPRFFGIMDLTSGYHQAPMSEACKKLTAFVTAFGVFEWNRVPMGLKAAGSYFQRTMVTQVLTGLIFNICECYLDDIITYGGSEEEFLTNLEAVFARLRQYNVTLNPAKCKFGMSEIEYVGHVINVEGRTFTRDKLDSVVNFPQPKSQKEMKSFLGLANYFRLHIRNHTEVVAPLEATVNPYKKSQPVRWTESMDKAFTEIKELINACPKLYFFDSRAPVFLQTDASMRGIGAYLFQVIDGKEVPIEFLSKAFTREQTRWSTPEQEAYAIFYALRKWNHLLQDVKFTLQTDHRNLVYMNRTDSSAKVRRWKMLIQEYDFVIEHIPGVRNIVADAFSRLCPEPVDQATPNEESLHSEFVAFLEEMALEDEFLENYTGPDKLRGIEQIWAMDDEQPKPTIEVSLPQSIYDQIKQVHNSTAGHGGVRRTLAKLKGNGAGFSHMEDCVKKFIRECPLCQKTSQRKVASTTLPFTLATTVAMQSLSVDSIGPLPEDEEGYKHILVIIDKFSRWVSLYPLRTLEATETADALIQHCGIFGAPACIDTDGGSQFKSVVDEVISIIGARHNVAIAHSHQESGIVERANKEVMRYLRGFVFEQSVEAGWKSYLPFTQRICNSEVVQHLGVTPATIIFGGAIDLNRGILKPNEWVESHEHDRLSGYANKLIEAQKAAIEYAAKRQKQTDDRHLAERTGKMSSQVTEFAAGTRVLMEYPNDGFLMRPRPPNKLLTPLRGPLIVISNNGPAYTLRDETTTNLIVAHVSRLREFFHDKERVNPVEIAMKDTDQFLVESILDHRGYSGHRNDRKTSRLEFLVKWVGYPEPEWLPWRNLYANSIAHDYMKLHPTLRKVIPKRYLQEMDGQDDS